MKQSDCTSMIHQTAPPTTQPPLSVEGIIWSRQGLHRHATSYNWNKKKEASEGNAASGICESGIGVQTAIQQCQPADGRLAARAGPLVSHQQRNQERRRGDEGFKEGGTTSEFGFISLKTTDFNSAKCSGGGTGDGCLRLPPGFPLRASLFPRVTPASLSSDSSLSPHSPFLFLKHHRSKSADK